MSMLAVLNPGTDWAAAQSARSKNKNVSRTLLWYRARPASDCGK